MPWQYNGISIQEGLSRFQEIPYLKLGIASRADWVANILLFIPLAFFWMVRLSLQQQLAVKLFTTVFVLVSSIFLCVSIEFTQLFFPPRTVSLNDVIAETLGAVIGIAAYWLLGGKFIQWLSAWQTNRSDVNIYLQIYLGLLFLYNVLPLDLTLSPVEFYHKWREGRIILLPFYGLKGDVIRDIYDSLADIVLWVPVPWLWLKNKRLTSGQLLMRVFIAALIVEIFQLFVYSRVTDVTDVLLAVIGASFGVGLLGFYGNNSTRRKIKNEFQSLTGYLLKFGIIYCVWGLALVAVFWYPYNFKFDYSSFSTFSERFFKIPFKAYYYGTEYRAITEVFHKILFLMPLGVISGLIVKHVKSHGYALVFALGLVSIWPIVIEFGQLFLLNKNADITDLILEVFGGYLGIVFSRKIFRYQLCQVEFDRHIAKDSRVFQAQSNSESLNGRNVKKLGGLFGLASSIFFWGMLVIASQNKDVPYNVRELFSSHYPAVSSLGITLLLYWCFAYPLLFLLNILSKNTSQNWFWFRSMLTHSFGAWLLIRFIVPIESIHDVIGSPILSIPNELEMCFRFLGLFGVFSLMMMGGSHCALLSVVANREFKRLFFLGGFCLVLVLPICFWIVVVVAATDNLTELMDNGGYSFFIINILVYLFLISWLGTFTALVVVFRIFKNIFLLVAIIFISFPLGYQLLSWGTEQFVLKYNAIFSAMQFLLSSERQNLISDSVLRIRFFIMHLGFISITMLTQIPLLMAYYYPIKNVKK